MQEITPEYLNKLAEQLVLISSLLGGFSIAVIANFLVSERNTRLSRWIMAFAIAAACFFLVSVFAMTDLLLVTTEGYPSQVPLEDLLFSRLAGFVSLLFGVFALLVMIALSGWTKSRGLGWFTTLIGLVTFIMILRLIG